MGVEKLLARHRLGSGDGKIRLGTPVQHVPAASGRFSERLRGSLLQERVPKLHGPSRRPKGVGGEDDHFGMVTLVEMTVFRDPKRNNLQRLVYVL